jgi:hypothetical protein
VPAAQLVVCVVQVPVETGASIVEGVVRWPPTIVQKVPSSHVTVEQSVHTRSVDPGVPAAL